MWLVMLWHFEVKKTLTLINLFYPEQNKKNWTDENKRLILILHQSCNKSTNICSFREDFDDMKR